MATKRIIGLPQKPPQTGDSLAVDSESRGTYRVPLGQSNGVPMLDSNGALADPTAYLSRGQIGFYSANWDAITTSGVYNVEPSGGGGANYPPTPYTQGTLIVYATPTNVVQLYVPNAPGDIYIRRASGGTFGSWQTVGSGGGGSSVTIFEHVQGTPASTWILNHNLGYYPDIHVYTSGNSEVLAEIVHTSVNQAIIYFNAPTTGRARCV